jgi:hypothetical protein
MTAVCNNLSMTVVYNNLSATAVQFMKAYMLWKTNGEFSVESDGIAWTDFVFSHELMDEFWNVMRK